MVSDFIFHLRDNRDERKLIVPKFALPPYCLFLLSYFWPFWVLSVQNNTGLDRKIYNHGQKFRHILAKQTF